MPSTPLKPGDAAAGTAAVIRSLIDILVDHDALPKDGLDQIVKRAVADVQSRYADKPQVADAAEGAIMTVLSVRPAGAH